MSTNTVYFNHVERDYYSPRVRPSETLTRFMMRHIPSTENDSLAFARGLIQGGYSYRPEERVSEILLSLPRVIFPLAASGFSEGMSDGATLGPPPDVPNEELDPEVLLTELLIRSYLSATSVEDASCISTVDPIPDNLRLGDYLKDHGYEYLAKELEGKQGPFWESLRALRQPEIMEQLVDLHQICALQVLSEGEERMKGEVLQFALALAKGVLSQDENLPSPERRECCKRLHTMLGRLTYLANRDLVQIAAVLDVKQKRATVSRVTSMFEAALTDSLVELSRALKVHRLSGLQSPRQAGRVLLPKLLARTLLGRDGSINTGILGDLRRNLLSQSDPVCRTQIEYVFRKLQSSSNLRESIRDLALPAEGSESARALIRIASNQSRSASVTIDQVREAVLTAMLSYMRQGESRACFASALAILLHNSAQGLFVQDAGELIHNAGLQREVDGQSTKFPMYLRMGREAAGRVLSLDPDGKISGQLGVKLPFWESPAFQAVCKYFELDNCEERGRRIHFEILDEQASCAYSPTRIRFLYITVEDILDRLVAQLVAERGGQQESLLYEAFFVYESQISPPLLRVWENVIAAMAEASENSINRPMVLEAIKFALERKLKPADRYACVLKGITEVLERSVRLVFDPSIRGQEGVDGHSSQGGFRLIDATRKSLGGEDSMITDPKGFQEFVVGLIDDVEGGGLWNAEEEDVFPVLREYVMSVDFVKQAIRRLEFHKIPDPIKDHHQLQYAPWCIKAGANFKDVIATYFGVTKRPQFQWAYCPTAELLLDAVIGIIQKHQHWVKQSQHPRKLIPARAQGMHVFSLLLDDRSMRQVVASDDVAEWVQEELIVPGRRISESMVTHETRQQMLAFCFGPLLKSLEKDLGEEICLQNRSTFHRDLIDLPHACSVKSYRDSLFKTIGGHLEIEDPDRLNALQILVDEALIQALPRDQSLGIHARALRFGDTHWLHPVTLRDIYFAFVYNPGTCSLELAKISDDNTEIQLVSQKEWLEERNWEFCSALDADEEA